MRCLIVVLFLFVGVTSWAQTLEDMLPDLGTVKINTRPPSPETASFGLYTDISLNYYIGAPNVSIPIYTIEMNQLSLPLVLSYNASGLIVENPASWVGAGWSFNPTGVVSRTVLGAADESAAGESGYFNEPYIFLNNGEVNESNLYLCEDPKYANRVVSGELDTQPDFFSFSLPNGQPISFIFNKNIEPVKISLNDVEIHEHPFDICTGTPSICNEWKIKGEDGTIYTFGEPIETSQVSAYCSNGGGEDYNDVVSAWYLKEIYHNGEWIRFKYNSYGLTYWSQSETLTERTSQSGPMGESTVCEVRTITNTPQLSSITTSNGIRIEFETSARQDPGLPALDKIMVKKDEKFVKGYMLHKGYFSFFGTNTKLKLDAVYQIDAQGVQLPGGYSFNYYNPTRVPYSSKSVGTGVFSGVDYYGYYNGAPSNQSLIERNGGNRQPSFSSAVNGALKEITYPTGGSMRLEYESRRAGLRVNTATIVDPLTNKSIKKRFEYFGENQFTDYDQGPFHTEIIELEGTCDLNDGELTRWATYNNYQSRPLKQLIQIGGSVIGHSEVREYMVNMITGEEIGLTIHQFVNESPNGGSFHPVVPDADISGFNGKKKAEFIYKKEQDQWISVKEVRNNYEKIEFPGDKIMAVSGARIVFSPCEPCAFVGHSVTHTFSIYQNTPYWFRLSNQATKEFNEEGFPSQEITNTYIYDRTKHHFPVRIEATNSKNQRVTNIIERDLSNPALVKEVERFIEQTPGSGQVYGQRMLYNGKLPLKESLWDNESGTYFDNVDYMYDGNLLVGMIRNPPNGMESCFTWGYNGSYVIAEIENASQNQVFHTSFEDDITGIVNYGKTGNKSKVATGYSHTLNSLVPGKYRLSYWEREAATWRLVETTIDVPGSSYTIMLNGHIDEVRFHPLVSHMTTYTYKPGVGVETVTDNNNVTRYYEYDDLNRLARIIDNNGDVIEQFEYKYSSEQ